LWLGWLATAFAVPMVLLPPVGGVVADRVRRVRLLAFTQTSALLLAAALALLTWRGALRPAHLVAAQAIGGTLLAFDNPARQALVPDLVPRAALQNALSLNAATFTGAALVGPALAGALLDRVGAAPLFAFNAVSFLSVLVALVVLRDVRESHLEMREQRVRVPLGAAVLGGLGYVVHDRAVAALLALATVGALCARSYPQLLPVFAADRWHVGARGYGVLLAAGGAGALVGAFGLSSARDLRHKGAVLACGGFVLAAALVAFALAREFALGVALLVVAGMASTVFTTMISTVLQLRVPPELRGRVISLYVVTLIGLPNLGALGVAAVARALGGAGAAAAAGSARALVGGATILLFALALARSALREVSTSAPSGPPKARASGAAGGQ
jgi:MFS family permease